MAVPLGRVEEFPLRTAPAPAPVVQGVPSYDFCPLVELEESMRVTDTREVSRRNSHSPKPLAAAEPAASTSASPAIFIDRSVRHSSRLHLPAWAPVGSVTPAPVPAFRRAQPSCAAARVPQGQAKTHSRRQPPRN